MKYTFKRMIGLSIFGSILMAIIVIFVLENTIMTLTNPLVTTIFAKDDYEYSISIPDYWEKYQSGNNGQNSIIYTGNNSEYLTIDVEDFPEIYDAEMYGAYKGLDIYEKYGVNVEFNYSKNNNKNVYTTRFKIDDINYVIGFVENDGFILNFEYKRPSSNNINEGLYTIISSIERFKVEEVELNGKVNAE